MQLQEMDLSMTIFGLRWGHTRSFANRLGSPDAPERKGGVNGAGWILRQLKSLDFKQSAPGASPPTKVGVIDGASSSQWFELSTGFIYGNRFGKRPVLTWQYTDGEFVYLEPDGTQYFFYDHLQPGLFRGRLKKVMDPGGHVFEVVYTNGEAVSFACTEGTRTAGLYYAHTTGQGLQSVTYRVTTQVPGQPPVIQDLQRVVYSYYDGTNDHGNAGDLETASVEEWDGVTQTWRAVRCMHYRYYLDGSEGGYQHGLRYVIGPVAYAQMQAASLVPEQAGNAIIAAYADHHFKYSLINDDYWVSEEWVHGAASLEYYSYEYVANTPSPPGPDKWTMRTTESRPDGTSVRVFSNASGQVLMKAVSDGTGVKDCQLSFYEGEYRRYLYHSSAIETVSLSDPAACTRYADRGRVDTWQYLGDVNFGKGLLSTEGRQVGTNGSTHKLLAMYEYTIQAAAGQAIFPLIKETRYQNTAGTVSAVTEWVRTYHTDTNQAATEKKKMPIISTAQNGTNVILEEDTIFDTLGRPTWRRDARGVITFMAYDLVTGALIQRIDDVDTAAMPVEMVPAGWATVAGFGMQLITDFTNDSLGRVLLEMGPLNMMQVSLTDTAPSYVRRVRFTTHRAPDHERRTCLGYAVASSSGAPLSYVTVGSVTVVQTNPAGQVVDETVTARQNNSGPLTATESFPRSLWSRWTHTVRDTWGRVQSTRAYFDIPSSGEGTPNVHYLLSQVQRDNMSRENRLVDATGTIQRLVYEAQGLVAQAWTGTNDTGATATDPAGGGNPANNMRQTEERYYAGGGLLTHLRLKVDATASNDRVTDFTYDNRDRLLTEIISDDGTRRLKTTLGYDNQDRVIQRDGHSSPTGTGSWTLMSRQATSLDNWGRVFKLETHGVNPSNGETGGTTPVTAQNWYDGNSNVIKSSEAGRTSFSKIVYDSMNRPTVRYLACVAGTEGVPAGNSNSVTTDIVIEQEETMYNVVGIVLQTVLRRRLDTMPVNATGQGALLDAASTTRGARVSSIAYYPDVIGRQRLVADFGTNGGAYPPYPATAPERSDLVLVTTTLYKDSGEANRTIDPMGLETRWENDKLGRRIRLLEGVTLSPVSNCEITAARTTEYAWHASGQLERLTQINPTTGDQVTRWVFGSTLAENAGGIASNRLLRAKIYPESDDQPAPLGDGPDGVYARLEYIYNRQGQVIHFKDADTTVHEYEYDRLGRETADKATTLGPNVDNRVRRITREYEVRGMVTKVTSHSEFNAVGEVQMTYSPFGLLLLDYQSHSGPVNPSTTPKVEYAYTNGSGNKLRRTSITYPNTTRVVAQEYGTANSVDDHLARIVSVDVAGTNIASYLYCGADWQVEVNLPSSIQLTFKKQTGDPVGDAGDIYNGYDRFDRAADLRWRAGTTSLERVQYGFDRNSRRTWRRRVGVQDWDRGYRYDVLGQVTAEDRGDLNLAQTAIAGIPEAGTRWGYDATGNIGTAEQRWPVGTPPTGPIRLYDKGNRLTSVFLSAAVTTDRAGRVTSAPPLGTDWSAFHTMVWDAWGRIVEVRMNAATPIAYYAYDGLHRRIQRNVSGGPWYIFYNDAWKPIEERRHSHPTLAAMQYFWGARHRDELIRRDRAPTAGGGLTETRYVLMDYFSPLAITNAAAVVERYTFGAFGERTILNASNVVISASTVAWEFGFQGQFLDTESGFYNYGYRYYSPPLGRFLSKDPIMEAGGLNLYRMAGNEAVNAVDYLGLKRPLQMGPQSLQGGGSPWHGIPVSPPVIPVRPYMPPKPYVPPRSPLPTPSQPIPVVPTPSPQPPSNGPSPRPKPLPGRSRDFVGPPEHPIHHDPGIEPDDQECRLVHNTTKPPGQSDSKCCWYCVYHCTGGAARSAGVARYRKIGCPEYYRGLWIDGFTSGAECDKASKP